MPATHPRPSLASFWHDLPHEGRLLLSVVAFEFVGTGLVLPFWVVYLHEIRGFSLDVVHASRERTPAIPRDALITFMVIFAFLPTGKH